LSKKHFFLFLLLFSALGLFAQRKLGKSTTTAPKPALAMTQDSLPPKATGKNAAATADTLLKASNSQKEVFKKEKKPFLGLFLPKSAADSTKKRKGLSKPKTALVLAILPGGGQVYNKKYWKVPIVWGVLAGMGYLFKTDYDNYAKYRLEYINRDQNPNSKLQPYFNRELKVLSDASVQSYRDQSLTSAEYAGFGLFMAYVLQGVDAFVDAHLATFDMSDDLSMRIKPSMESIPTAPIAPGIGLSFCIGKHAQISRKKLVIF
jgi:hypothetical protein